MKNSMTKKMLQNRQKNKRRKVEFIPVLKPISAVINKPIPKRIIKCFKTVVYQNEIINFLRVA